MNRQFYTCYQLLEGNCSLNPHNGLFSNFKWPFQYFWGALIHCGVIFPFHLLLRGSSWHKVHRRAPWVIKFGYPACIQEILVGFWTKLYVYPSVHTTVDPLVSDHPKCKGLVVTLGGGCLRELDCKVEISKSTQNGVVCLLTESLLPPDNQWQCL